MASTLTASIASLPNELVIHILSLLDAPSYFEARLRNDPSEALTAYGASHAYPRPLKCASLVCRLWRSAVLPVLFRHVLWSFGRFEKPAAASGSPDASSEIDFLRFLLRERLTRHVQSLTIVIQHPDHLTGEETLPYGVLQTSATNPSLAVAGGEERLAWSDASQGIQLPDQNWLWHAIFQHLDPLRLTIFAYPALLGSLLSRPVDLSSAFFFKAPYHILSLSRPPAERKPAATGGFAIPGHVPSRCAAASQAHHAPCDLFSIRPWSSLHLNEGLWASVYSTYEYHNHRPPSVLPFLLDRCDVSLRPLLDGGLTALSYVAGFPLFSHITDVLVPSLPPAVRHFYIKIVPDNLDFLELAYRPASLDYSDLWMERNIAYSELMRTVFGEGNDAWHKLEVFETGDAHDKEAWDMAAHFVESTRPRGWRVAGEGFFVREVCKAS